MSNWNRGQHRMAARKESNKSQFCHNRESIRVILPKYLSVTLSHQPSLKTINLAIRTKLDCVKPSTSNRRFPRGKGTSYQDKASPREIGIDTNKRGKYNARVRWGARAGKGVGIKEESCMASLVASHGHR
ncbi:hypothetical protein CR513_55462, partial [Mucuna pruriens]